MPQQKSHGGTSGQHHQPRPERSKTDPNRDRTLNPKDDLDAEDVSDLQDNRSNAGREVNRNVVDKRDQIQGSRELDEDELSVPENQNEAEIDDDPQGPPKERGDAM